MSSSRGKGLEEHIIPYHPSPDTLLMHSSSGATLARLCSQAKSIISSIRPSSTFHPCHVYFIGGYCDLSQRIRYPLQDVYRRGRPAMYEEYVFMEEPAIAVSRMTQSLYQIAAEIRQYGAIPVFSTIPPSSIETWNQTRLSQKKTTHLNHYLKYPTMQDSLLATIIDVNHKIIQINNENSVHSPFLADTVIHKPGQDKKHRPHYSRLSDGVHPTESTKVMWANKLLKAILKNRPYVHETSESGDESDVRRAWMY